MSDPTETVPAGPIVDSVSSVCPTETVSDDPIADSVSSECPTEAVPAGPIADSASTECPTETVSDGPAADSVSGEWTQRFLDFGFLSVCAIAEIVWITALAWATLSLARWLFL